MEITDSMPVEFDLRPAYYDDFHCLADKCRLSCCEGWRISFDKKDYMKLKRTKGSPELDSRMAHGLRRIRSGPLSEIHYGEFQMSGEDLDCPLHCENGLCLLQIEKGHGMLPEVCRVFPRQERVYLSGYLERSLSPACEAVLALLWDLPDGIDFVADPLPKAEKAYFPVTYRGTMATDFQEVRSRCIDILQDRRMPLPQRMMLLGMALKKLVDGEKDLERWMAYVELLTEQAAVEGISLTAKADPALFLINNIRILQSTGEAKKVYSIVQELLSALDFEMDEATKGSISVDPYLKARARYEENFAGREYFMENLMVSLFFQMQLPALDSMEQLWRGYVAFCNMYGFYRFLAVMSCRDGAPGDREELFHLLASGSRKIVHNRTFSEASLDSFYRHDSATLAHMAILLSN